jgi:hypothetical protein
LRWIRVPWSFAHPPRGGPFRNAEAEHS